MNLSNLFSIHNTLYHFKSGYDLSYIEAIGVIFGILCIWFASKEKIINFYFGLVNVSLFAIIFYQIQLYANLLLQIFFLIVNIYGIYTWSRTSHNILKIHWLSKRDLILTILGLIIGTVFLAIYINQIFSFLTVCSQWLISLIISVKMPDILPDSDPWLDAIITVFSMVAMIQMARKLIENWVLWLIVDILSMVLYYRQGVYIIACEYLILTLIVIGGLIQWIRLRRTI